MNSDGGYVSLVAIFRIYNMRTYMAANLEGNFVMMQMLHPNISFLIREFGQESVSPVPLKAS